MKQLGSGSLTSSIITNQRQRPETDGQRQLHLTVDRDGTVTKP
ncbi:hypothetical protein SEA_CACTOJAQUE_261 [Mycobacterium phage Cactojaque]|nr:hypothetical protein SEA_KBOOGIE_270 [Mycobacterium phage Kboogie]QFP98032.1 hypothetical protein SEA_CACTOJAQUE_261 [Mycobacterium phage Cactojaque]URP21539.1 hypothetical protein SEA_MCGEE_268 [Mycobacterium phage McGee]